MTGPKIDRQITDPVLFEIARVGGFVVGIILLILLALMLIVVICACIIFRSVCLSVYLAVCLVRYILRMNKKRKKSFR